jgi:sodium/hydrogen exchanger 8
MLNEEKTQQNPERQMQSLSLRFGILILSALLATTFFIGHILHELKFPYLQESGIGLLLGAMVGAMIRFFTNLNELQAIISFDQQFFFFVLLPPIIFESGYTMKKGHFFYNIDSILAFAVVGTTISMVLVSLLSYSIILIVSRPSLSLGDCLLYGALISATDPVTVLAVFKQLGVDTNLYANVFGESVLNDAVAIVLYKTVVRFVNQTFTVGSFFIATLQFCYIFGGSLVCAAVIALWSAWVFKYTELYKYPVIETCLVILFAYFSYLIAEGLALSGIVAVFFCGITMAHYTYDNLSKKSQKMTRRIFEVLAFMAETFVFIYLGLAIFSLDQDYEWVFILLNIFVMLVSRAGNIFPLSWLVNLRRSEDHKIPFSHQIMLWYSGLRGALAFALTLNMPTAAEKVIQTTTLMMVVFTVLILGGGTVPTLRCLRIKSQSNLVSENDKESNIMSQSEHNFLSRNFIKIDRKYLKPLFCRVPQRQKQEESVIVTTELEELHPSTELKQITVQSSSNMKSRDSDNSNTEEKRSFEPFN